MKKFLIAVAVIAATAGASFAASPTMVLEVAPITNQDWSTVSAATGSVSAVTVSSSVITKIDTAFNAAATSALGGIYQRAEITAQNNGATTVYCGYSASGVTVSNSFALTTGAVWTFKIGKTMGIYCLSAAGSSGTLIVGGIAWK
jgi:hypothetical protein